MILKAVLVESFRSRNVGFVEMAKLLLVIKQKISLKKIFGGSQILTI